MGCMKCVKYLVFFFNLLFWICGMAILGLAIYLRLDKTSIEYVEAADQQAYFIGCYILMGAGAVMTFIGFLGCCGAYHEHRCMLATFFVFLLIILSAEIAAGVFAYVHSGEIEEEIEDSLASFIMGSYGKGNSKVRTEAIDSLQENLECCGGHGPQDYLKVVFTGGKPPTSCGLTLEGCGEKLMEWFKDHLLIIMIVGFSIAAIEILGMVLSMVLCCQIHNRYKGYKA